MDLKELELPELELVDTNADYSESQLFYIDFDGADNVSYINDAFIISIENITIEDSGLSSLEQTLIISQLNEIFAGTGISFTVTAPAPGEYSTIYVGSNSEVFSDLGSFAGLSETIDAGNGIKDDNAFVFVDNAQSLISTIVHETGHLLGFKHSGDEIDSIYDFAEASVTAINYYETYSMVTNAINAVDDRLAVSSIDDSVLIFSLQDHDNGIYIRNTSVWTGDVDLTCISPWNDYGANVRAGTLITAKHIIFAAHLLLYVGDVVRFVTMDNEVIERTIVSVKNTPDRDGSDSDYAIAEFDEELPDSITSANLLPSNFDTLMPSMGAANIPGLLLDQVEHAIVGEISSTSESSKTVDWTTVPDSDDTRAEHGEAIVGGDSGNPSFIIVDDQLVLMSVWSTSDREDWADGTNFSLMKYNIQTIINTLSGSTDYELKTIDISHFTTYEAETSTMYTYGFFKGDTKDSGTEEISGETETQSLTSDADVYGLDISEEKEGLVFEANGCVVNVYGDISFSSSVDAALYVVNFGANSGSFTLHEDASMDITVSIDSVKSFGVYSYDELTSDGIAGQISIQSEAIKEYAIAGVLLDLSGGDISGNINVVKNATFSHYFFADKFHSYGLFSLSDLITADISGTITVSGNVDTVLYDYYNRGNSLSRALYAQGNMVIQDISGTVSGSSTATSENNAYADAYGLYALGTMELGAITGTVESSAYSESGEAYARAIHANGDLTIAEISGNVTAYAQTDLLTNVTMANAVRGDVVSGTDGAALVITGDAVVAAYAIGNSSTVANAIVATGGMNLDIYGTVSASGTNESGTYRSLYAYGDADDSVILRSTAEITGDIVLNDGDDNLTIEAGLAFSDDIDFGDGNDTLTVIGKSTIAASLSGELSSAGTLALGFDISTADADSSFLDILTDGFGDSFSLNVDYSGQVAGEYYLINSTSDISSFYSGKTFLINDLAELIVGGDSIIWGGCEYELDVSAGNTLVLTVLSYDIDAPSIPLDLTATIDNDTATVLLDWSDSTDLITGGGEGVVAGYVVEYSQMSDFSERTTLTTSSVSEITVGDVYDGTWYWRVAAVDLEDNVSDWSETAEFEVDLPDILAPDVPDNLTPVVDEDNVFLDWSDSTDNKSGLKEYVIEYSLLADFTDAVEITVSVSELSLDRLYTGDYYWRGKAVDNAGNESDWRSGQSFYIPVIDRTAPSIPVNLVQDVDGDSVALDWDDSADDLSGVDKYIVEYSSSVAFDNAEAITVYSSNLVLTGLTDNIWHWRVKAVDNDGNEGDWSRLSTFVISISDNNPPSVPVGLKDAVNYMSAHLDWSDSVDSQSSVARYIVEYSTSSKFLDSQYKTVSGSELDLNYLAADIWYWRVMAVDSVGNESDWSDVESFDIRNEDVGAPETPVDLTSGVSAGSVLLDWRDSTDNETGVKEYIVAYSTRESFTGADYEVVAESEINLTDLLDGVYYWRVSAVDYNDNVSDWSSGGSFSIDLTPPDSPSELSFMVDEDDVVLDWNDSFDNMSGLSGYIMEYGFNVDFNDATICSTSGSTFNLWDLVNGAYYWRVKAVDNNGNETEWVQGDNIIIDNSAPTVPLGIVIMKDDDSARLDWSDSDDNLTGVKGYIVEYASNSLFSNATSYVAASSEMLINDLMDGNNFFRVKAVDNNGNESAWSETVALQIDESSPETPSGLTSVSDGGDVSLDWQDSTDDLSGVKEYLIQLSSDADFLDAVSYVVSESYLDLTDQAYGNYYWRARAVDNAGNESEWTEVESFATGDTAGNQFSQALEIVCDTDFVYNEYVGKCDGYDYYKFDMENAGTFNIALVGLSAKVRVCLYELVGNTYKKVKGIKSKNYSYIAMDDILLERGTYYLEVMSEDKGAGRYNTDYSLELTSSCFPEATDNNSLETATEITLDFNMENGYVGFGDAVDYYKFEVDSLDVFDFELAGDNKNAKMTVYEWDDSKDKYKKVAAARLKNGDAMLDNISLDAGLYYVEVLSKDKGKGKYNTEYELNITTV